MRMLQVVFADPADPSLLRYSLFSKGNSKYVVGNPSVEMLCAKVLLTDPGTNAFSPGSGAGLRAFLKQPVTKDNVRSRCAELARIVLRVEQEIIASQKGQDLSSEERLRRVELEDTDFNFGEGLWTIRIRITMEDGNVKRVLLTS